MPPFTVASLTTIITSLPDTRPIPAMRPAEEILSSYMPQAANCPISRNGEPASRSCASRSRGKSLPREVWRSRASSVPPLMTDAAFASMSLTNARIRSVLAVNVSEAVLIWDVRMVMRSPIGSLRFCCQHGDWPRNGRQQKRGSIYKSQGRWAGSIRSRITISGDNEQFMAAAKKSCGQARVWTIMHFPRTSPGRSTCAKSRSFLRQFHRAWRRAAAVRSDNR